MVWLWVWGIVTAIALVVECLRANLIAIWIGAGGLVTLLVVALTSINILWQLLIFIVVSCVLLLCTHKSRIKAQDKDDSKKG